MILKGGSRGKPLDLADHVEKTDTNERVVILEMNSGLGSLAATLRDWQTLSEGTRGKNGLYHLNADPDARYDMTPEKWLRCANVAEEELGLQGQPRAIVMHEKKGRQHIHVIWCRTDLETMTLRDDSFNYLAHERASLRLEREFGHEHVPGKHAKRDREKQPEFPRSEINHAEWQQAERAALSVDDRRAQNRALKEASDNGASFKSAIEDAGYVLARGDKKDFVLVTAEGSILSLGRELDMKAADLRAFMADVDRAALPTAAEAKAMQRARQSEQAAPEEQAPPPPVAAEPESPPVAADLESPVAENALPPVPENAPVDTAPDSAPPPVAESVTPPVAAEPEPPATAEAETPEPPAESYEDRLRKAVARRQESELWQWRKRWGGEIRRTNHILEGELTEKMEHFDAMQEAAREIQKREHQKQREDIWERIQRVISPAAAGEKAQQREQEREALYRSQEQERRDYLALQLQTKQMEMDALRERHAQQLEELQAAELERYLRDREAAQRLWQELREKRAERQEERERGPWPDLPPPRRGK